MTTLELLKQRRDEAMATYGWNHVLVRAALEAIEEEEYRLLKKTDWYKRMAAGGPAGGCDAEYDS